MNNTAAYDKYAFHPIRIEIGPATLHIDIEGARHLRETLLVAIVDAEFARADVKDTDRPPPPLPHGIKERTAAILSQDDPYDGGRD